MKSAKTKPIARGVNHWHIVTYGRTKAEIEPENKPNSLHVVGGLHAVAWRPQGAAPRAGFPPEEHEESENCLSIPFPLHSTLPHLLNLLNLLVAGLIAVCSPCSRFRLLLRSGQSSVKPKGARWRCAKSAKTKPIARDVNHWHIATWDERRRKSIRKTNPISGRRRGAWGGRTVAKGRWGPTTLSGRPKVGGPFRLRDLEGRLNSSFLGLF